MFRKFIIVMALLASGCAVGPLVSHETARSVGDGHHELIGGYGMAGAVLKWNYGLTENFDLGLQIESLSVGIRAKYAFVNGKSGGNSFAIALGTGSSIGGSHTYGDIMWSHLFRKWEPYSTFRYVHVKTDPLEFQDENTGTIDFTIDSTSYEYGQVMLGTRYWFSKTWFLSLEASSLIAISSSVGFGSNAIAGLALGANF